MVHRGVEAEAKFTHPVRQLVTMIVVLVLVGIGAKVAYPTVAPVFLANPYLNAAIALVFVIGVFACFWQVFQLFSSVGWIEGFAKQRPGFRFTRAPRLLAPLAALLRSRNKTMQIGASSARSILDSVATRIEEARDITRYLVNLLIFLGLLGTFWGLSTTVPAVVETIRQLAPTQGESGLEVFHRLLGGLEKQLGGMGVAFSSSLLGLAGSLVVGLLELFASHGQNRFYRELEEWLSTITKLSFASGDGEHEPVGGDAGMMAQMAEYLAERMDALQAAVSTGPGTAQFGELTTAITALSASLGQSREAAPGGDALDRLAASQERLAQAIEGQGAAGGIDTESRMRLRSMDVQLLRILEEMAAGRQETVADLRGDIAALTRAIERLGAPRDGARH